MSTATATVTLLGRTLAPPAERSLPEWGNCPRSFWFVLHLFLAAHLSAASFHVDPSGDDSADGSLEKPFPTIQQAVNVAHPGDTVIVHAGRYRESVVMPRSGTAGHPIAVVAAQGEYPVLDGTDPVSTPWTAESDGSFSTQWEDGVEQVFFEDHMLVEARWPNMAFPDELWDRTRWAGTDDGSTYSESTQIGLVVDAALAETGIDFTGAWAMLNISHQNLTWTAQVRNHSIGSDRFNYDGSNLVDLKPPSGFRRFDDDFYYLFGIKAALDAPGEWFYDDSAKRLYVIPPEGESLEGKIRIKRRNYGISLIGRQHIEIQGLRFFASTFRVARSGNSDYTSTDNRISQCHARFPSYDRFVWARQGQATRAVVTLVEGQRNRVEGCSLAYPSGAGLLVSGSDNVADNNLVHNYCWSGSGDYFGLQTHGRRFGLDETKDTSNRISHNTVYNGGNALLGYANGNHVVEYNHTYNGGLAGNDTSLVYTLLPRSRGSVARYNWIHGNHSPKLAMGYRADDKGRGQTIHHNVIWDCSWEGLVLKGDEHTLFHNTIFDNDLVGILAFADQEQDKSWHTQWPPLDLQNTRSRLTNNATTKMLGMRNSTMRPGGTLIANYEQPDIRQHLMDPANFDFRPKPGSPLIDAGQIVPGHRLETHGEAPDIGAYEWGAPYWVPGITWEPETVIGYTPQGFIQVSRPAEPSGAFAITNIEWETEGQSRIPRVHCLVDDARRFTFALQRSMDFIHWDTVLNMSEPGAVDSPLLLSTQPGFGEATYTIRNDTPMSPESDITLFRLISTP